MEELQQSDTSAMNKRLKKESADIKDCVDVGKVTTDDPVNCYIRIQSNSSEMQEEINVTKKTIVEESNFEANDLNADIELYSINDSCQYRIDLKHSFIQDFNQTIKDKEKQEQKQHLQEVLVREINQSPEEVKRTMMLVLPH